MVSCGHIIRGFRNLVVGITYLFVFLRDSLSLVGYFWLPELFYIFQYSGCFYKTHSV
ncbi:hypothetical protein BN873_380044 [Candidatus Competibacter denitrificans Run_A_D11]|uniref:Uncharacterized protein n=1 Tax=Candidatus Competibacter denitrificans Run_A_D11 TaxID=1400863 RepID=W6M5Q7_9GAMM|nr:hypothetical protein BN873_380044 [Candidatus Competibacter denitrificans Run_A_D11]